MEIKHVDGKKRGDVILYALSTCVWCKKTKKLLSELGVEYSYIDVDLLSTEEKKKVEEEVRKWNPAYSFPTTVINNERCILGFRKHDIIEALG